MLSDSVMICQWAKLFTQLMRSRMTICSGVSNGSAALATIRAFPAAEIIRFYYGPSTRLAQALFWGEYHNMFNADRSDVFKEGVVRVHLRRWLDDEDSWTLARYICSPLMQSEVSELYRNLQVYQINSPNLISQPDQALRCGFPFAGPTTIQGICLRLPGPTPDDPPRWLVLRIERCSAPFPFDLVIVDRDNSSARGPNVEDENLDCCLGENRKTRIRGGGADTGGVLLERGSAARPGAVANRFNRKPLRILERQGTAKRREGSPTLPSYPHEGGRQPNAHWLGDGPGDVGHQQLAAHQADHRSNASTETPGCSGLAGQFGDVCKGDRIVSGTAVMGGRAHWLRPGRL